MKTQIKKQKYELKNEYYISVRSILIDLTRKFKKLDPAILKEIHQIIHCVENHFYIQR